MKWMKTISFVLVSLACFGVIALFECNNWPVGSSVAGVVLGFSIPACTRFTQDLCDTSDWKTSQRRLKRGGYITDDSTVRISFAYLFRIKIGDKYLLVKNNRGTDKYQPVGGVYKLKESEKVELRNRYKVMDDNKIPIDQSSRNDYRLRLANRFLRRFVKRFDGKGRRERVDNLSREFREELIETGILNWEKIKYRYCGRYISELHLGEHFQMYELLIADVVELLPTEEQERDLLRLAKNQSKEYYFATAEEIESLGINTAIGALQETIGDHAKKTIQENEGKLMKMPGTGEIFTVDVGICRQSESLL